MGRFGLTRDEVISLVNEHITNENLRKHCLATEAIMRKVAERLGEDVDDWGLIGLIHDLDYEQTKDDPARHTLVTADILRQKGVPEDYIQAIISHNEAVPGTQRSSPLEHLLAAGDNITGLIVATALVMPDKKLASVKPKSVRKRMKEKAFARAVDRSAILECEQAGIPIDEFIQLCLQAMQEISDQLGL
ncbi:HDIG domain-containing protein [Candidatus Sumerlaeota bacterium]|nr:HDIG domain-containing protein [Candidatus Sumerlaeota bacterium]